MIQNFVGFFDLADEVPRPLRARRGDRHRIFVEYDSAEVGGKRREVSRSSRKSFRANPYAFVPAGTGTKRLT